MIRIVVAIRDRASDTYGSPFLCVALGQAVRSFRDELNRENPENALYNHPEDFDLFELGTFDDTTGLFECGQPRQVAVGKDLSERRQSPTPLRQVS